MSELQALLIDSISHCLKNSDNLEQFKTTSKPKLILTTDQLMLKLGVTRPTLSKWRKEGRIPFIQEGSVVRYDLEKVLEALENKKRRLR
ncbi:helix-turn-helix domain-containing protein [Algoriphagus sediminis]|uniref:helix-turn-helix domain-containing protein n=1 Tax=Algoriphagus sediminis TaxID=3057113 RepID=UPI00338ECCE2